MINNNGYLMEEKMRQWFRGQSSHEVEWVDFFTKTTYYEVKSCKLLRKNDKVSGKHSHQLGRFFIVVQNHRILGENAKTEGKKAKYIFVIVVGKQLVWKTKTWDEVNTLLGDTTIKNYVSLRIKDVFDCI